MRSQVISTGGGTFDKSDKPVYFLATSPNVFDSVFQVTGRVPAHCLVAVNELHTETARNYFDTILAIPGMKLFLDSGIFNLSTAHAKAHNISMDQALSLSPEDVDGFSALFDRYVALVRELEGSLWGYVELDQGGRENKIRTRRRLERLGLKPIPVFHPVNDGLDYFDYLAQRYDRICVGNLVNASPPSRTALLYEIHRRWQRYPNLWIHALGVSPNHHINTYQFSSCDSSSWIGASRWGMIPGYALDGRYPLPPEWLVSERGGNNYKHTYGLLCVQAMLFDKARRTHFNDMHTILP